MIKISYFAAMMLLIVCALAPQASSQEQVSQTVYVFDGDFNGTPLAGVQIAGQDAVGKSFSGITDANGNAVVSGQAGEWLFVFIKDGYETLDLNYNVTESGEGAVYLVRSDQQTAQNAQPIGSQQPEAASQADAERQTQLAASDAASEPSLDQVSQTVYVYDGDFNGSLLSGVQIAGQDAAGRSFGGITDSNGIAVLSGKAGEWRFEFEKDGYKTLDLNYNVTESGDGAVYLVRSEKTSVQVAPYPNDQPQVPINQLQETSSIANATEKSQLAANESQTASAEFWLENGNFLYEQGRYDEAAQSYDRCISLNPQIETAWFNKGNAYYMQGDYDNALSAFDKSIQLNTQDANAWICRGLTLKKLNRNMEANAAFMQAKGLGV